MFVGTETNILLYVLNLIHTILFVNRDHTCVFVESTDPKIIF